MSPNNDRRSRRAFTLVELMIGMVVLAMVALALVGVCHGVCDGWRAGVDAQDDVTAPRKAVRQLQRLLRQAKQVTLALPDGRAIDGSGLESAAPAAGAALFLRQREAAATGVAQLHEIALIEHDRASGRLVIYRVPPSAANASTEIRRRDIDDSGDVAAFKQLASVQATTIATDVTQVRFRPHVAGGGAGPSAVEIVLSMQVNGSTFTEYATATLRAPAMEPLKP
jgi:prepilin-type N-terminal cleavage/methylation domain-containing protein